MALDSSAWKNALKPKLEQGLKGIYARMHDGDESKDDAWLAGELAELLATAISDTGTAQIRTAGVPAGSVITAVVGQATGTPNAAPINVA